MQVDDIRSQLPDGPTYSDKRHYAATYTAQSYCAVSAQVSGIVTFTMVGENYMLHFRLGTRYVVPERDHDATT
jgi:hypothetical protein